MKPIVHIYGASGSGVTTLGRALAKAMHWEQLDCDDYFWMSTAVPYTVKRPAEERVELMTRGLERGEGAVVSGSLCGWGDLMIPRFTLAVRLYTDTALRIQRLKRREKKQFGSRIEAGGDMAENHRVFLEWAAGYDEGGLDTRSRTMHDAWEKQLHCPVLRLSGSVEPAVNVSRIRQALKGV